MISSSVGNSTKTVLRYNLISKHFGNTFYDALIVIYIFSDFWGIVRSCEGGQDAATASNFLRFLGCFQFTFL